VDKFDKSSWKRFQQIVDKYLGEDEKTPKITPIFAHAPDAPVSFAAGLGQFSDVLSDEDTAYSYVSTLIRKGNTYEASIRAYLMSPHGEVPIVYEHERFPTNAKKRAMEYMCLPFSYFKRSKHLRVMTFKNSDMKEEDFENLIEIWRTAPPSENHHGKQ
jgi:hypothetical protein